MSAVERFPCFHPRVYKQTLLLVLTFHLGLNPGLRRTVRKKHDRLTHAYLQWHPYCNKSKQHTLAQAKEFKATASYMLLITNGRRNEVQNTTKQATNKHIRTVFVKMKTTTHTFTICNGTVIVTSPQLFYPLPHPRIDQKVGSGKPFQYTMSLPLTATPIHNTKTLNLR